MCYTTEWPDKIDPGKRFNIIDCPGLDDTRDGGGGEGKFDNMTLSMVSQLLKKNPGKIHLVLLVYKQDAFSRSL